MGPYETAAPEIHAAGLNPVPIQPGAKEPAIKWRHWQTRRMPAGLVERFRGTFGEANVGTTTGGVTGLLVVDIDSTDENLWKHCLDRFGDTPAQVQTASGKLHLWYASPKGARNAQRIDGMPVDVRADGGIIVLPPSVRPGVGDYVWLKGDLSLVRHLPPPRLGSLSPLARPTVASSAAGGVRPEVGQRNDELFRVLRLAARDVSSLDELRHAGVSWNETLDDPLGLAEVARTANSVWHYKVNDSLLTPGSGGILLPRRAIADLALAEADAVALLAFLRMHHAGVRSSFALSVRALAGATSWSERRLRRARNVLIDRGLLVVVSPGGPPRQPAMMAFAS